MKDPQLGILHRHVHFLPDAGLPEARSGSFRSAHQCIDAECIGLVDRKGALEKVLAGVHARILRLKVCNIKERFPPQE